MALVEIARFHDPIGADIARGRLAAAGVAAVLLDHNLSSTFGGALMPSRLMVPAEDEHAALSLLKT